MGLVDRRSVAVIVGPSSTASRPWPFGWAGASLDPVCGRRPRRSYRNDGGTERPSPSSAAGAERTAEQVRAEDAKAVLFQADIVQ
jgi:hypothetical protein